MDFHIAQNERILWINIPHVRPVQLSPDCTPEQRVKQKLDGIEKSDTEFQW